MYFHKSALGMEYGIYPFSLGLVPALCMTGMGVCALVNSTRWKQYPLITLGIWLVKGGTGVPCTGTAVSGFGQQTSIPFIHNR